MNICQQKITDIIVRELDVDASEVKLDTPLVSLVTDSLEMANLILELEAEFGCEISDEAAQKFVTVKHAVEYLELAVRA